VIVNNGGEALEFLKDQSVDLILMDIQMPVMDGYETTKRIRNELKLYVSIIAMNANAMAGEYEKCISSGMNDYITKPFKADTLIAMIEKYLRDTGTSAEKKSTVY
ncbi:MAG TPA: response regulator, partial [Bacteroidia bacterium]